MFNFDLVQILIGVSIGILLFNLFHLMAARLRLKKARQKVRELEVRQEQLAKSIKENIGRNK